MALKIARTKFLDSWESHHLSKAALKRSLNFSIFITMSGTLILAHCVKFLNVMNQYLNSTTFTNNHFSVWKWPIAGNTFRYLALYHHQ